jgi:succinyl-CoA synthetase alpha subunit
MIWNDVLDVVLVQGITGTAGRAHLARMRDAGTPVVAGTSPGHEGEFVDGIPVYASVAEALRHRAFAAAVQFVPGKQTLNASMEALRAGLKLVVALAEGVPVWDAIELRALAREHGALVLGPNTAGVIRPDRWKLGIMPHALYSRGHIGVLSRSGSVMHDVAYTLTHAGIGQSTCVDIGGDRVVGNDIVDVYRQFISDEQTDEILIVGEIGSDKEERLAAYLQKEGTGKPTAALIVGRHAPQGRRMGHAAAIVHGSAGSASGKEAALADAGVSVCANLDEVVAWTRRRNKAWR